MNQENSSGFEAFVPQFLRARAGQVSVDSLQALNDDTKTAVLASCAEAILFIVRTTAKTYKTDQEATDGLVLASLALDNAVKMLDARDTPLLHPMAELQLWTLTHYVLAYPGDMADRLLATYPKEVADYIEKYDVETMTPLLNAFNAKAH